MFVFCGFILYVDRFHIKLQNLMKFKFFSLIKYDVKTDIAFKCGFRK